jgi:hypothetical protein
MSELPKQNADQSSGNPQQDNFDAEEIAEQSIYENETQVAQQIRRGGETDDEKADDRDVVGKADIEEWDQRQINDTPKRA